MQITPHFGSYHSSARGIDPFNRNSSTAPNTSTPVNSSAPTNAASVDLAPVSASSSFDSDTVSKNILSFVQRRLTQAAQQGAAPDQLAKLLDQAREGATSGFDQAIAQLKGSGDFSDGLSSGIGAALQKVDKGFDDLAKQFGIAGGADNVSADTATPAPQANTLSQLAASYSAKFSSRQSVDLIVKTADGDTVRLQLDVKNKQSIKASYRADANGEQLNIASKQRSSAGLNISVDGNLNADELAALDDLLKQVGELADTFFGGDLQAALQQASSLDFSNPELSSLSLNLRSEVRSSEKVAAYQQVQGSGNESSGANIAAPGLATLSSLADALASLVPKASVAANPASLLKQLLAAQLGAINSSATDLQNSALQNDLLQNKSLESNLLQNNPLLNFANRLLTALGADRPAAQAADKPAAIGVGVTAPNPTADTTGSGISGSTKPNAP